MREMSFPSLSKAGVEARMEMWGPIPRLVLQYTSIRRQQDMWTRAAAVSLDKLTAIARDPNEAGTGAEGKAPLTVVHQRAAGQDAAGANPRTSEYYSRGSVVVGSAILLRHVADRINADSKWNAAFLVDASVGIPGLGSLRGLKFEELALDVLSAGGPFICKVLGDSGRVSTMTLPCLPRVQWSGIADVAARARERVFLTPPFRNQVGLDCLMWDDDVSHHWPVDCTVSKDHGIHVEGLATVLASLGWTSRKGWPVSRPWTKPASVASPAALSGSPVSAVAGAGTASAVASCPSPSAAAAESSKGSPRRAMQIQYYWAVPEDVYATLDKAQIAKPHSLEAAEAKELFRHVKQLAVCVPKLLLRDRLAAVCKHAGVATPDEHLAKMMKLEGSATSSAGAAGAAASSGRKRKHDEIAASDDDSQSGEESSSSSFVADSADAAGAQTRAPRGKRARAEAVPAPADASGAGKSGVASDASDIE